MTQSLPSSPPCVARPSYRTLWQSLPGRALGAAVLFQGGLWLILDPDKIDISSGWPTSIVVTLIGG